MDSDDKPDCVAAGEGEGVGVDVGRDAAQCAASQGDAGDDARIRRLSEAFRDLYDCTQIGMVMSARDVDALADYVPASLPEHTQLRAIGAQIATSHEELRRVLRALLETEERSEKGAVMSDRRKSEEPTDQELGARMRVRMDDLIARLDGIPDDIEMAAVLIGHAAEIVRKRHPEECPETFAWRAAVMFQIVLDGEANEKGIGDA